MAIFANPYLISISNHMRIFSLLVAFLICQIFPLTGFAQDADKVLFTVDGQAVTASEFTYIYSKNNRDDADFSEKSLREYLDLYKKFKLKVREAYAMKLDTLPQLQNELGTYRKQLADTYLNDKEITDRLVREAYERTQSDVNIAHILVRYGDKNDTLASYSKIQDLYAKLQAGESWNSLVKAYSEDTGTKDMEGDLGYITALLPNGFYALETAAYETPVGAYSKPVKTNLGYHIVKVLNKRPARGEVEVSHILLRVDKEGSNDMAVKKRIDGIYSELKAGGVFEELAKKNSDDKTTADRGGIIGPISINQFERAFEEAAFGLNNDGEYSQPVRTRLGWHIIKRIRLRPVQPFESIRRRLEVQIAKDERVAIARHAIVTRIKKEGGYQLNESALNEIIENAGADLQTYKWQVPNVPTSTLFTLGGETFTNIEFGNYVRNNARIRMSLPKGTSNKEILEKMVEEFSNEKALVMEEKNLAAKYPEFKSLMREYEEGILLFEATKQVVWDMAGKDTVGLKAFHAANRSKYKWDERVEIVTVSLDSAFMSYMPAIKKAAMKKNINSIQEKYLKKKIPVHVNRRIYQKDEDLPEGLSWTAGEIKDLSNGRGFVKVDKVIPPTEKSLDEARGFIISDYQEELERKWVAELQSKYKIVTDEAVLKSLIRS